MDIGGKIKELRQREGLTQEELAKKVGVTSPMISQLERGSKILTVPLGKAIAQTLHCTLNEFVEESGNPE